MGWTWHDRYGQYPNAERRDGDYTHLTVDPQRARVWRSEEDAAASAYRATKAGIAQTVVVEVDGASRRFEEGTFPQRIAETSTTDFRCFASFVGADRGAVLVQGEVDLATGPIVSREVLRLSTPPVANVTVDLASVTFIDSSGLASLISARDEAAGRGVEVRVTALSATVRLVVDAAGVAEALGVRR
jgi:anti-anti-sigma factor